MLVEVGDYFCVPEEFKPFSYMGRLVSQRNSKMKDRKFSATRTNYGTIVMLAQVGEEIPPHEYVSPDGILSSTSRSDREPSTAKLTQQQIINRMTPAVREANLPWWFDPQNGRLLVNPKICRDPELELWHNNKFSPKPEDPYPAQYRLDENLLIRPLEDPMDDDEDDIWAGESATGETSGGDDD